MSQVLYELKTPFSYAYKGDTHEASFIELKEPTRKDLQNFTPIQQAFTKAVKSIQDETDPEVLEESKDKEIESEEVSEDASHSAMFVLHQSDEDMVKVGLYAAQLFKNGGALIDGDTPLTIPLQEKMSMKDWNGLLGTYIVNFIAPSR